MQLETRERPPAPVAPSVHRRALITWLAIFPLVLAGQVLLQPLTDGWPLVLRTLLLTLVVVPAAAYVVIPSLFKLNARLTRRLP